MSPRSPGDPGASADGIVPSRPEPSTHSSTQTFYGRWARIYDQVARRTPGIGRVRRRVADACRLTGGETVVEVGCGTGANLRYLADRVGPEGTVVGIDVTPEVLRRAREATRDLDTVHVVRGDATRPPIADEPGAVDAVVATFLVGMLQIPEDAVSTWCDMVGPDGRVVLANATRTDHWAAPVLNGLFRGIVAVSTPPATKLRYDDDPTVRLAERVATAHGRLRARSRAVLESRHYLGLVRLTGGIVGDPRAEG